MKYPMAGDLQRETTTELTANPCGCPHRNPCVHKNPWEVRSDSGIEGVFANEDEAHAEAIDLRKAGARNVVVDRREKGTRPRVPRHQIQNPAPPPAWRDVSRSVTNMQQNIEIFQGDGLKATSYFRYIGVDVDGVGYGWLHRCYNDTCIVELTDGTVDVFPASKVWPVAGRYPEHRSRAVRANPASSRLFAGVTPTGIAYADKQRERDGDYLKVAFLPFQSLRLQWSPGNHPPELRELVQADADAIIARRGQPYEVSSSGQTVILGGERARGPSAPPQYHERQGRPPGVPNPARHSDSAEMNEIIYRAGGVRAFFGPSGALSMNAVRRAVGKDEAKQRALTKQLRFLRETGQDVEGM